jgi:hypothetical protein
MRGLVVGREAARIAAEIVDQVAALLEGELVVRRVGFVVELAVEIRSRDDQVAESERGIDGQCSLVPLVIEGFVLEPHLVQVADARIHVAVAVGRHVLVNDAERHVEVLGDVEPQRRARAARLHAVYVFINLVRVVKRSLPGSSCPSGLTENTLSMKPASSVEKPTRRSEMRFSASGRVSRITRPIEIGTRSVTGVARDTTSLDTCLACGKSRWSLNLGLLEGRFSLRTLEADVQRKNVWLVMDS